MGGKQLHEKDREHKKNKEEMPRHHYRIVKVFIKTRFNAVGASGVTVEIIIYGFPWKLSQKDGHKADAEQTEPHSATFIGGSGVHRSAEDWDKPGNYCCHRSL